MARLRGASLPQPCGGGLTLAASSVVVATRDLLSSNLAGETVILHLAEGVYYGLDSIGTRIWALIQEPRRVAEVCERLTDEYEVDAERCERAVLTLLGELSDAGLIEAKDEPLP